MRHLTEILYSRDIVDMYQIHAGKLYTRNWINNNDVRVCETVIVRTILEISQHVPYRWGGRELHAHAFHCDNFYLIFVDI